MSTDKKLPSSQPTTRARMVTVLLALAALAAMAAILVWLPALKRIATSDAMPVEPSSAVNTENERPQHAVLVDFTLSDRQFGMKEERESIYAISEQLEAAIRAKGVGEFDGEEFGEGVCTLYMYGPEADAMFAAIEPILRASPLAKRTSVTNRYGEATDPDAKEVKVVF